MIRPKILNTLVGGLFATLLFSSLATAQTLEIKRSEVSAQGTGFFTMDTDHDGFDQETTKSGGLLASYRFRINGWVAADGSYGYTRNTQKTITSAGRFNVQSDVHQVTGAVVITSPKSARFTPFALAGGGALIFDPTNKAGGFVSGNDRQTKAAFVYGGGADLNLTENFALRVEYRGLVHKRPDFGLSSMDSDAITHTAQPSVGFVIKF